MQGVTVACIGPVTAKTAEEYGMRTDVMPREYTIPALVDAMVGFYQQSVDATGKCTDRNTRRPL